MTCVLAKAEVRGMIPEGFQMQPRDVPLDVAEMPVLQRLLARGG